MNYEYSDPNQIPVSNIEETETEEEVVSSTDGIDLGVVEQVPGFRMRTTVWSEEMSDEDMNLSPAWSASYPKPESVCGNDDRVQINDTTVFPYKCIARLRTNGNSVASGFFIGPRCIITSGHVVFPRGTGGNWAEWIEVSPGQNGNIKHFGSQVSKYFFSVKGWTNGGKQDYDYGAIILPDTTLYNRIKACFGYQVNNNPGILHNSGYPGRDKPDGTQWFNAGPVGKITPRLFHYMIDTAGGHSGSPVWWIKDGDKRIAVGVHGYGGCPNKAIRCIDDVARNWGIWCNR